MGAVASSVTRALGTKNGVSYGTMAGVLLVLSCVTYAGVCQRGAGSSELLGQSPQRPGGLSSLLSISVSLIKQRVAALLCQKVWGGCL